MNSVNYNSKIFKTVKNTENGEVGQETIFHYYQEENTVWAEYSGGGVVKGHLVGIVDGDGCLDMRYHHINDDNEIMTGICKSKPEFLDDGRLRIFEEWEWTCKDRSKGYSVIEEMKNNND